MALAITLRHIQNTRSGKRIVVGVPCNAGEAGPSAFRQAYTPSLVVAWYTTFCGLWKGNAVAPRREHTESIINESSYLQRNS